CKRAGITPDQVLSTLSGYYGGQYVSNFNRFSKVYKVMIQADPEYRLDETSLNNTFVRMANGEMAPLSQFVTLTRVYGAESLSRFNMYNSIAVNAMPAEGYSTGDAIRAVQETAATSLPKGYGYDYGGITREENQQSGTTIIIFAICFLMIYLILSALYESFIVPFAVLLSVPCGLMGSFLFARMFGLENNIYLQTGLIMLIGLLAKTAILLTEYASERRKAGMGLIASALSAAKARFRPILMTVLTMVFGLLPLMVASGVGANGNRSLGTGTVGGMVVGTLALLFIVPSLFIAFQWLQERLRPVQPQVTHDWQIEEEIVKSDREKQEAGKE
ncbi:efflux RND transporter permease subunit, partial [Bacteroides nordii]